MTITFDSSNKNANISLSGNDLVAALKATGIFWLSMNGAAVATVNFGGSAFTYSMPVGYSAYGAAVTLDGTNKAASIALSNGDLTATGDGTESWRSVAADTDFTGGKLYLEITVDTGGNAPYLMLGVGPDNMTTATYVGDLSYGHGYSSPTGRFYNNTTGVAYGPEYTTGDIIMLAIDADDRSIFFGKNGVWIKSSPIASEDYGLWLSMHKDAIATVNFGGSDFTYDIPNGFVAYGAAITLDGTNKAASIALSNGDLTATGDGTESWRSVAADTGYSSGKKYLEITIDAAILASPYMMLGVDALTMSTATYVGSTATGYSMRSSNGYRYNNGAALAYGVSYTLNDVVMIAMDFDNDFMAIGVNGVWLYHNNPTNAIQATTNLGYDANWHAVAVTEDKSSGKHYLEISIDELGRGDGMMLGVDALDMSTSVYVGSTITGYGCYSYLSRKHNNSSGAAYGLINWNNQLIIMLALDLDNGKIWWGANGIWFDSGDPAAGTGYAYSPLSGDKCFWASFSGCGQITINLKAPFAYTVPSGFTAYDPTVGWTGKINGVSSPAKINGIAVANIHSINGVE